MKILIFFGFLLLSDLFAKPFPNPSRVDVPVLVSNKALHTIAEASPLPPRDGTPVLRVEVGWNEAGEKYEIKGSFRELSGTTGLLASALRKDELGSFKASLKVVTPQGETVLHSSLGTGREFRYLVRTLCFRFPLPDDALSFEFRLEAEHPENGRMLEVLTQDLRLPDSREVPHQEVSVTLLRKAIREPSVKVAFYAEGFSKTGQTTFLEAARRSIAVLEKHLPGSDRFEFRAVFADSKEALGPARDLGPEIRGKDTFLGLYFPYWRKMGRWYSIVYPTNPTKYRNSLAQSAYDYPIALVDDREYWGVGNYMELTAIPVHSPQFNYLLLHEFGHFMGLNEEYEGGGPTELEFAPGIKEPWSQNITFNTEPASLKWRKHLAPGIEVPTSISEWHRFGGAAKNPVGAYRGGYADSLPRGKSHKPVLKCMMSSGGDFCPVCSEALVKKIELDAGK